MAKLVVLIGEERTEHELRPFNSIGRHPDNTIQVLDRIVSKEHAHIQRLPDGRFLFKDLGSLNGTYFAGARLHERVLVDGDEITMGTTKVRFVDVVAAVVPSSTPKLTIAVGVATSHIRQKLAADDGDFVSEKQVTDERQLRRDYERLRLGHMLARAVGSELDLEKLLPKILDQATELVGADRGAILFLDDKGEPVPQYIKTRNGKGDNNLVLSRTVLNEVIANRAAVLSSDASVDSRFAAAQSIIMQGIRSTMTLPLLVRDELLGLMHLDSLFASNAFTEKDLQICTGIATQAAIAIKNARLAKQIEQEAQTRAQISRLIPPSVVDQVMKGELVIEKGGRLNEITMLFSDIRGFTSMSDGTAPEEVVSTLNEYFEVMVDILFRYSGTLDKFVGDEIIGLFGAPIPLENAPVKAVFCALAMMQGLEKFNQVRVAQNQVPLQIGIGINTGSVITGSIGSTRALQYTAIGDAMNVASRLCNVAAAGEIIISEATYREVGRYVEAVALAPVKVKGKAETLQVYRILGPARPEQDSTSSWGGKTSG